MRLEDLITAGLSRPSRNRKARASVKRLKKVGRAGTTVLIREGEGLRGARHYDPREKNLQRARS